MIEITLKVKNVDYGDVADKVLPVMLEKYAAKNRDSKIGAIFSKIKGVPEMFLKSALKHMDESTQEDLTVFFLNENKDKILQYANNIVVENGVKLDVCEISIEKR